MTEFKEKIKSVENIKISYYDRFYHKTRIGKIKAAGTFRITYFDSFGKEKARRLKLISGSTDDVFLYTFSKMN